LALVIYTGFTVPTRDMVPWFRWMNYLDPIAYGFESLMINEFSHRDFPCAQFIPSGSGYENAEPLQRACNTRGSIAGEDYVNGDAFINTSFSYYRSHLWRNFGIILVFLFTFAFLYFYATEKISAQPSKGEVLVFRRGHKLHRRRQDEEAGDGGKVDHTDNGGGNAAAIHQQTDIFQWKDVCYGGFPTYRAL
jgi:ATP-binding cassette, subfamily G (WHITE), member 2, PDR